MRIQETDRILKESRVARNHTGHEHEHETGMISRMMHMVSSLPSKLTGMFRKH
jgi:hypothetical protein